MDLPTLRARVRKDLRDETPSDQRWSDGELDRHIARAVDEASLATPRELTATLTSAGTRNLSISTITGLIAVEAVEYPIDQDPASFTLFSLWGTTLTVLGPSTATNTTLPLDTRAIIAQGTTAWALKAAANAVDVIHTGGPKAAQQLAQRAASEYNAFERMMRNRRGGQAIRSHRLYTPAQTGPLGQSQDPGP